MRFAFVVNCESHHYWREGPMTELGCRHFSSLSSIVQEQESPIRRGRREQNPSFGPCRDDRKAENANNEPWGYVMNNVFLRKVRVAVTPRNWLLRTRLENGAVVAGYNR